MDRRDFLVKAVLSALASRVKLLPALEHAPLPKKRRLDFLHEKIPYVKVSISSGQWEFGFACVDWGHLKPVEILIFDIRGRLLKSLQLEEFKEVQIDENNGLSVLV